MDFSKTSICFLAGTLGQGGAERQLYYMLRSLRVLGAHVQLISLTQGEYWEQTIRQLGIEVHWLGSCQSRLARVREIARFAKRFMPDIVQSQHFYTNIYAAVAARYSGCRDIGAIRNDVESELASNGRLLGKLCLRLPRVLAVNSSRGLANARRCGANPNRLYLLPNVVDLELFSSGPRERGPRIRIVCVGRLVKVKRVDRFLKLIAALRDEMPEMIEARVIGEGPERARLEEMADTLGLLPDVLEFTGAVSDTASVFRQADVVVLCSEWEGTPNVLLEAMACGVPVVATDVGGVSEIVQHDHNGFVVPCGAADRLLHCVRQLVHSRELRHRLGSASRDFVVRHHSPDTLTGALERLYEKALQK
jgi:glycosyltransferase involved in cell wall biosynthesis